MAKNVIRSTLLLILVSCYRGFGQSHSLPQPMMTAESTGTPPPPPGLPLPIDDYIPYLLLLGIIYGAVKIPKLKKT